MDDNANEVLENNTKENYVKKLNASNEAKRLEDKVKTHHNNLRKNSGLNSGVKNAGMALSKSTGPAGGGAKATTSLKYGTSGNSNNSQMTNQLASKGLTAAGVPKPLADAAVNSKLGQKVIEKAKSKNPALNMLDKLMGGGQKETEEQSPDGGEQTVKLSLKALKILIMAMPWVCTAFIFMCLFMSATQIYLNSVGLGSADSVSQSDAESKIEESKNDDDKLNTEIKDEAYIIQDNNILRNSKLEKSNLVKLANKKSTYRPGNEADLSELHDYYSTINNYSGEEYNQEDVYTFFYKLLYIQRHYDNKLDMPLLMATLRLQSTDMSIVFSSNIKDYDKDLKENNPDFEYTKDWSGYITNKNTSTHDIEVLAQHMVSNQVKEACVDSSNKETKTNILKDSQIGTQTLTCGEGETYKTQELGLVLDNDKYKEFLKEFIEKKYYLTTDTPISGNDNVNPDINPGDNSSNYNPNHSNGNWKNWKQCGESWSNITVPKSSSSMCQIGCLITSISIQIARSGTATLKSPIDPGVAVQNFSFVSGGNFVWASTTRLAPNFQYRTAINLSGMNKASIAQKLSSYDPNKYYIVLAVSKKNRNSVHHYVALDYVDQSNGNIYIMDPAGKDPNLYNVYKLYKAHIYEKKD